MRKLFIASFLALAAVSACGNYDDYEGLDDTELGMARSALGSSRGWTQADVTAIEREIAGERSSTYRLRLPVFRGTTIVGAREVGTMPISDVNLIATRLNVAVRTDGFAMAARMCCGGTMCGASGGGSGGANGGGSGGTNGGGSGDLGPIAERLSRVLVDLNASEYQFLF
ncbi:MAG: hypothetical protein DI536_22385 [Archangium gephyra]|uniref:Lipoprotein n=1 Tax=Archangium gephyra TaxID=48 RepID=A0A2W5T2M6_9BACT|nr:MAG: hypothetical protein DI536_22385 [Archangium gephyra]